MSTAAILDVCYLYGGGCTGSAPPGPQPIHHGFCIFRRTTTQTRRVWTHLPKRRGSDTDTGCLEGEDVEEKPVRPAAGRGTQAGDSYTTNDQGIPSKKISEEKERGAKNKVGYDFHSPPRELCFDTCYVLLRVPFLAWNGAVMSKIWFVCILVLP